MIKLHYKVYNTLAKELQEHTAKEEAYMSKTYRPWLYLVASKSGNDMITKVHRVQENTEQMGDYRLDGHMIESCYRMSALSAKIFVREATKLMRKGWIVRGLVRVGNFHRTDVTHHQDGDVEYELNKMNPDTLFITVEPTGMYAKLRYKTVELGVTA